MKTVTTEFNCHCHTIVKQKLNLSYKENFLFQALTLSIQHESCCIVRYTHDPYSWYERGRLLHRAIRPQAPPAHHQPAGLRQPSLRHPRLSTPFPLTSINLAEQPLYLLTSFLLSFAITKQTPKPCPPLKNVVALKQFYRTQYFNTILSNMIITRSSKKKF